MNKELIAAAASVFIGVGILAAIAQPQPALASRVAATNPTPVKTATVAQTVVGEEFDGVTITKTEEEWRKQLTPDEFGVLREKGTERPYTGALTNNHKRGTYYCAACGLALFRSNAKFESGTGWPSFFQPIFKKNVTEKRDNSISEERVEVECSRCHGHLGHVFDDGPQPTGLRYCMNSVSLKFKAN